MYDLFDAPVPLVASKEKRLSKQKRIFSGTIEIYPKRKKYDFQRVSVRVSQFKKGRNCGAAETPLQDRQV